MIAPSGSPCQHPLAYAALLSAYASRLAPGLHTHTRSWPLQASERPQKRFYTHQAMPGTSSSRSRSPAPYKLSSGRSPTYLCLSPPRLIRLGSFLPSPLRSMSSHTVTLSMCIAAFRPLVRQLHARHDMLHAGNRSRGPHLPTAAVINLVPEHFLLLPLSLNCFVTSHGSRTA